MNKKIVVTIICIILALASIAGVVVMCLPHKAEPSDESSDTQMQTEESSAEQAEQTEPSQNDPFGNEHTERQPIPVIEFDSGNEVYLDEDVIEKLTELESAGNEDLVNAMLDGTILLINEFAEKGYSLRAMHQIQRFYFLCYDELKDINIVDIASKLEECFTTEGVFEGDFASDIERLFGFPADTDYSYIFDMGDDE